MVTITKVKIAVVKCCSLHLPLMTAKCRRNVLLQVSCGRDINDEVVASTDAGDGEFESMDDIFCCCLIFAHLYDLRESTLFLTSQLAYKSFRNICIKKFCRFKFLERNDLLPFDHQTQILLRLYSESRPACSFQVALVGTRLASVNSNFCRTARKKGDSELQLSFGRWIINIL